MKRPDWPVAVIGAGTMGHGIAQVVARQGFEVRLYDASPQAVQAAMSAIELTLDRALARGVVTPDQKEATLIRIHVVDELEKAVEGCRVVVEAVPEAAAIKKTVFEEMDRLAPPNAILASNTSALSITLIAGWTKPSSATKGGRSTSSDTSAPAAKARLPVPVMIKPRVSASACRSPRRSPSSSHAARDKALRRSARFIVATTTPSVASRRKKPGSGILHGVVLVHPPTRLASEVAGLDVLDQQRTRPEALT